MSLIIRKVKMKTTVRYYYISSNIAKIIKPENTKKYQPESISKNVEKELSLQLMGVYPATSLANRFGQCQMTLCLSYDPAITHLGMYLTEICPPKQQTHTNMFKAALLLIGPNQEQPNVIKNRVKKMNCGVTSQHCTTATGNNMGGSHSTMWSEKSRVKWNTQ